MRILAFRGRIGRQTFFAMTLLLYALTFVFAIICVIGGLNTDLDFPAKDVPAELHGIKMPTAFGWTFLVVGLLGIVYSILGTIGLSVRRLHDFGLTGFLVLLYPVLKRVLPDTGWPDWLPGPADLLWFLIMIAQPGTRGPNAFGPDQRDLPTREPD